MSLGMVGTENAIKKFLKGFSDYAGFSTVANDIGRLFGKQGSGYSGIKDYLHRIGVLDSESDINSATTEANDEGVISINQDGSSNLNGLSVNNVSQLGVMGLEALVGGIPELQRIWSAQEAQKERDWQTELSNSAYQRSVTDMKAAGINPIMAYSQGGATSGSGAVATAPSSAQSLGSTMQGIASILSTVLKKDIESDKLAFNQGKEAHRVAEANARLSNQSSAISHDRIYKISKSNYYNEKSRILRAYNNKHKN